MFSFISDIFYDCVGFQKIPLEEEIKFLPKHFKTPTNILRIYTYSFKITII